MSNVLTIALVVLACLGMLALIVVLWIRSKVRKGAAWLKVGGLKLALEELRSKAKPTEPGKETDPDIADLLRRVETAHGRAEAAYKNGDIQGVSDAADAILLELKRRLEEKAKQEQAKEQQRIAGGTNHDETAG